MLVTWVYPNNSYDKSKNSIWVDVSKLDDMWKKDLTFYIHKNGQGFTQQKYERFRQWINQGNNHICVEMPIIHYDSKKNTVSFENGRHRFAYCRDNKGLAIKVIIKHCRLKTVEKIFGTIHTETILNLQ